MKDIIDIPLDQLIESSSNPRKTFDEEALADLAASIKEHGVQQPILVRRMSDLTNEIVYGHRRYRASKLAGLTTIPATVVLEGECDDAKVLELQLAENNQREDVDPLEESDAIARLMGDYGRELKDVAAKLGRSEQYVRRRLKLAGLIPELRQLLVDDRIGLGSAETLAALPDKTQKELAAEDLASTHTSPGTQTPVRWSSGDVNWAIRRSARRLRNVPWEMDEVFAGMRACDGCPDRTGKQSALPGMDDGEDRCLNPSCYNAKGEAKREELEARLLKKKGYRSFNKQQRKEIEEHSMYSLYFHADTSPYELRDDNRTYRELAPKAPIYIKAVWNCGSIHPQEWVSKSDVLTHLKEHEPDAYYTLARETNPEKEAKKKAAKQALQDRIDAVCAWAGEQRPTKELFRALVKSFLLEAGAWERKRIASNLMDDADPRSIEAYFADRLEQGTVPDLFRLAVELTVCGDHTGYNIKDQIAHWESMMANSTGDEDGGEQAAPARSSEVEALKRKVKLLTFQAGGVERPLLESRDQKRLLTRALKKMAMKDLEEFAAAYDVSIAGISDKNQLVERIIVHLEGVTGESAA